MTYHFDTPGNCANGPFGPTLGNVCSASAMLVFMSFLDALIQRDKKISGKCERVKPIEILDDNYDFVVIGGGAAGSVVASRLSENPKQKVLLLEAGPDEPAGAEVPSMWGHFLETDLDWNYTTTKEKYACLSTNGACRWKSGRNLGGNTAHNAMIYLRGNPTDYDNWAAKGNKGWGWKDVLPHFLMAEDNLEIERVGRKYHATGGMISVQRLPYVPPFGYSILAASKEAGYGVSEDLNGDTLTGFSVCQTTSRDGIRRNSNAAHLWPARYRKNLHVSLNSFVTRVIIEKERAVGVEYYKNGQFKTIKVNKEVIVSGGAVGSPRILLHSGIGPKEELEAVGVEVVKDLPGVGENVQNHISYVLSFSINETDAYDNDIAAATEYVYSQTGPMSGAGLAHVVANLATSGTAPDFPDLQIYVGGYRADCAPGEVGALRSTGKRTISLTPAYTHIKSRGKISLASKDPLRNPVILGNYLSDYRDVERLVEGIEMVLKLANTTALKAYNFTLITAPIEACSNYTFATTEYWACAIRYDTVPDNHQGGSCKMGPASDPYAVVDHELRVYGIKGLRVADASIMPQVTSANTATPTMMIGGRAVAFINKETNRWNF